MRSSYKIIILVIAVVLAGWFFYSKQQTVPVQNIGDLLQYSSDVYGISFSYPSGYVLTEGDALASDGAAYHQITLVHKEDLPPPVDGEGPTSITIGMYSNSVNKYTAEGWARGAKESGLTLGEGIIATTTIAGFPAISFRWSGLYEGTTVVLAKSETIYIFNVTYFEMGSQIVQDFVKVRDSVKFSK